MSVTFEGLQYKKGEMLQYEGRWYIAEGDAAWQNAADMEEGFDIFLPRSGYYTACREATEEEIQAHAEKIEADRLQKIAASGKFRPGQIVYTKRGMRSAVILEVSADFTQINVQRGQNPPTWQLTSEYDCFF
jgi:hypothetical protein